MQPLLPVMTRSLGNSAAAFVVTWAVRLLLYSKLQVIAISTPKTITYRLNIHKYNKNTFLVNGSG